MQLKIPTIIKETGNLFKVCAIVVDPEMMETTQHEVDHDAKTVDDVIEQVWSCAQVVGFEFNGTFVTMPLREYLSKFNYKTVILTLKEVVEIFTPSVEYQDRNHESWNDFIRPSEAAESVPGQDEPLKD